MCLMIWKGRLRSDGENYSPLFCLGIIVTLIIKLVSACKELFCGMVVIWFDYLVGKALKCFLPSHLLVSEMKEVIVG